MSPEQIRMFREALRGARKSCPKTNLQLLELLDDFTTTLNEVCALRGAVRFHKANRKTPDAVDLNLYRMVP